MYKYAIFYFKGGLKITGVAKDTLVLYNEFMKDHPIAIKITPLESVWTGSLHFVTHTYIRFSLWDLNRVDLVEDYLCNDTRIKSYLVVKENPKRFYSYWKRIARKLERLGESL